MKSRAAVLRGLEQPWQIEEITVDMPDRDNPMKRREHPGVAHYIPKLMSLLHLHEAAM